MQNASSNFAQAISASLVTWGKPLVYADWAVDGYGAAGTIDDLSDQVGRPIEITHYLDDGLPNEVTFAAGLGTPDLSMGLAGGGPGQLAVRDIFNRVTSSGLGVSTTGQTWSNIIAVDPTQISTTGNSGLHTHATAGVELVNMLASTVLTDVDATLTVGVSTNSSYADASLYIRATDSTHFYRVTYLFASGTYNIQRANGGGASSLQSGIAGPAATAGPIKIRMRMVGSTLQTMVWLASATPPTDFQATVTDSQLTQGGIGVGSFDTTAAKTFTFTDLSVTDLTNSLQVALSAAQYFSPFRVDSPVYNYSRDVAPVKVDVQAVTSGGLESIRVFTGQMTSTPTDGQNAALKAMSANRLKLAKLVQLPVRSTAYQNGPSYFGLTAAWAVTWAMHQCGVYPSPPAVSGARLWVPLHGGGNAYLPYANLSITNAAVFALAGLRRLPADAAAIATPPETVDGPYVGAAYGEASATVLQYNYGVGTDDDSLYAGSDFLSKAGNQGRYEMWLRGDTTAINSVPGGSGQISTTGQVQFNAPAAPPLLAGFGFFAGSGTAYVTCGIRATDRLPVISLNDGTAAVSGGLGTQLPTDSAWHFYGFAWDVNNKKLWFNVDGTITSVNITTASSANLPSTNAFQESTAYSVHSFVPISEVQLSAGPSANHDTYPTWMYNLSWTRGATVYPSILDLVVLSEPPREAWELIGRYAQAELAHFRADENDTVLYLPLPYWAKTAQQTALATLTARRDSKPPQVTLDLSKIRNSVRLTYSQTRVDIVDSSVWSTTSPIVVAPGINLYLIALTTPTADIPLGAAEIPVLSQNQINGTDTSPAGVHYISYNTAPDGSGTYPTVDSSLHASLLHATITDWTSTQLLLQVQNDTGVTYYVANNASTFSVDYAFMSIGGRAILINEQAYVTASETSSITTRGERALPIQIDAIQTETMAQQMANAIVGDLACPQPVIERLELFGDPRRQPGDMVAYSDPDNTGITGLWRMRGIKHTLNAASYTQLTTLRRARQVGTWDSGLWGEVIWGE